MNGNIVLLNGNTNCRMEVPCIYIQCKLFTNPRFAMDGPYMGFSSR